MPVDVSVLTDCEATTAIENFNSVETPLINGGSGGSSNWTNVINTGDNSFAADGTNGLGAGSTGDSSAYRSSGSAYNAAVVAILTLNAKNSSGDGAFGIYFALQGAGLGSGSPNGYRGEVRVRGASADEWRVQIDNGGTPSIISSGTLQEISAGDKLGVVHTAANDIELWWKSGSTWTFIVSVNDATYTAGGRIGVYTNDNSTASFLIDDLKVMNIATTPVSWAPSPGIVRVRMRAY